MLYRKKINMLGLPLGYVLETYDTGGFVLGQDLLDDGMNHEASLIGTGWILGYGVYTHEYNPEDINNPTKKTLMAGEFVSDIGGPIGDEYQFCALVLHLFGFMGPLGDEELTLSEEAARVRDEITKDARLMERLTKSSTWPVGFYNSNGVSQARKSQ